MNTITQGRGTAAQNPAGTDRAAGSQARVHVEVRCDRALRGPYTGFGELLRRVVPELLEVAPHRVAPHSMALVAIAPDLAAVVPTPPQTLTNLASGEERTRYYSVQRTRDLAHAVSELLTDWALACHLRGVSITLWEFDRADSTDRQVASTIRRRCDGQLIALTEAGALPSPGLAAAGSAQAFVDADGTSRDLAALAAYHALPEGERRRRHSARAEFLLARAAPGDQLGAIPYHLEHGTDPVNTGADALSAALQQCFGEGFYDAALDLARRGRAVLSPSTRPDLYGHTTQRMIGALTYLERSDEALAAIHEHRRITTEGVEQMRCCYMLSMLNTRHLDPTRQDQDQALAWVNTAIALADGNADPQKRAFFGAFMRNARALVELHRGNLLGSLDLVNEAIAMADSALDATAHRLHRTVLLHNRARVLVGLGDYEGAIRDFDEVIERDPEYDEPYFDRASAHRTRGDFGRAVEDLSKAISLSITFADAYYNRADIMLELGDVDRALQDLDTVLEIDPDHRDALLNRAAAHLACGALDQAGQDIEHGLQIDPSSGHLWSAHGLLAAERGNVIGAEVSYARALEMNPDLIEALGNRANLRFSVGRVEEAVADLDRAVEISDNAALRLNRGIGWQSLNEHARAIADFDAAMEMSGANLSEVLFRRGLSFFESGANARAEADWRLHFQTSAALGEQSIHADEISERRLLDGSVTVGGLGA